MARSVRPIRKSIEIDLRLCTERTTGSAEMPPVWHVQPFASHVQLLPV